MSDWVSTQPMRETAKPVECVTAQDMDRSYGVEYFSFYYFWFTQPREGGSTQ